MIPEMPAIESRPENRFENDPGQALPGFLAGPLFQNL